MSDAPNPFETPRTNIGSGASGQILTDPDLPRIALWHRRLNLLVLVNIVAYLAMVGLTAAMPEAGYVLAGALVLTMLVVSIALIISFFQLTAALGWSILGRVLCGLGLFIGLVNLLILIAAISGANKRLRSAGLKVGLLGVASADLVTWRRQHGLPGHE